MSRKKKAKASIKAVFSSPNPNLKSIDFVLLNKKNKK